MPYWFYNDGFFQLAKKLKTDYNLTVHYKAINDIQYYHRIINGEETIENVDLYLLPSDWLEEHEWKNIVLAEDITPFMHTIFNKTEENNSFIPYAIDPLAVLAPNSTIIDDNQELTWKDIASYIINQGQVNKIKMPILR
ncbi:hypothetical protein KKG31_06140 [Patescibacteria group bacterium]|nr:hypothetical protein [Patescibacteria group bacterium]MBU1758679.1 hypothetical protein [Patescibacteria group bacterium]